MGNPCFRSLSSLEKFEMTRISEFYQLSTEAPTQDEPTSSSIVILARKDETHGFIPLWATPHIALLPLKSVPSSLTVLRVSGFEELQIEHHQHCCSRNLTFNSCDPFYRRVTSRKDTFLASPVSACLQPTSTTTAPTAEWWCPNSEALRPRPINGRWKSSRRLTGPITKWWGWAHAKSFWMPATSIASPSSILRAGDQSPPITVTFKSRPCKRSKGIMHTKVPACMFPGFCEGKLQTRNLFRCARWAGVWSRQHQSTLPPVVLIATGMSSGGALLYRFACMYRDSLSCVKLCICHHLIFNTKAATEAHFLYMFRVLQGG